MEQANEQPIPGDLDSEVYVPGSQNGFSVPNGGTAEENLSTIQGRVQEWKQVGQTFVASDYKVGTQDFEKLVSTALHEDILSNPFHNGDGIEAEDVQNFLHYDHLSKAMFANANSLKMSMPTAMFDHHHVIQCHHNIISRIVLTFS
jgi:hypothetical protein